MNQQRFLDVFLDDKRATVELELLAGKGSVRYWSGVGLDEFFAHGRPLRFSHILGLLFFLNGLIVLFLVEFLPVHHGQEIQQYPFKFFKRVEYFNASASVESRRLQQPHITVFTVIGSVVDGSAEQVDLLLDVWVLAAHVVLHFADKSKGPVLLGVLPGIVLLEEGEKLLEIVLAVLVVEI